MIGLTQNIKTIWKHKSLFCVVILFLFSGVLKIYLPTTILPELLIAVLFIYIIVKPVGKASLLIPKVALFVWLFYFLYFIVTALASYWGDDGSGFFNENFRLLSFVLITILLASSKVDYLSFAKFCLWGCRFHILFTIFELFYLTFISFGDFYGVPLVGAAMPELEEGVGYLKENDNMFSYGFRPFGLMLQPQKTGFVFVVGVVLEYVIALVEKRKISIFWSVLFVVVSILQGAKTAILILVVNIVAIFFDFYPAKKKCAGKVLFYIFVAIAILYIIIYDVALSDVGNDTNARVMDDVRGFLSFGPFQVLFGMGTPVRKVMLAHGFSGESYLVRIFCSWGLILTIFLFYYLAKIFLPRDRKSAYLIVVTFWGMIYHYCVVNAYFVSLALSSIICLVLYHDKQNQNKLKFKNHLNENDIST